MDLLVGQLDGLGRLEFSVECVLGVSMTPAAVRMVLVEGAGADGLTVDHNAVALVGSGAATGDLVDQLMAAIVGTRDVAIAGGHHLISTGVAWTDRGTAAQLRKALTARGVEDVVLVSEQHAAGALAQAVGRAVGYGRTALMFLEGDTAALSIVDTATGAIVGVQSRRLRPADPMADLRDMAIGLELLEQQPQGLFIVGSGIDVGAVKAQIACVATLPVHAPEEAELALARGAALAAAQAPRYEATTVGVAYARDIADTGSVPTQLAAAGYMAPLGYSDVVDDGLAELDAELAYDESDGDTEGWNPASDEPERKPFMLVGSALTSIFVVGIIALAISLAVSIRPTADHKPTPSGNVTPGSHTAALVTPQEQAPPAPPAPVETIQEPVPVVQQAPRTVFVAPPPAQSTPAQAAPAPAPAPQAPVPAAPDPAPAQPAPVVPAAPVIPVAPPVYFPPQWVPPILYPRPRGTGTTSSPGPTQTSSPVPTQSSSPAPTQTSSPTPAQTPSETQSSTSQAPSQSSSQVPSQSSSQIPSQSSSQGSTQTTLWPPFTER